MGLSGHPASMNWKTPGSERDRVSKAKVEDEVKAGLWPPHSCTQQLLLLCEDRLPVRSQGQIFPFLSSLCFLRKDENVQIKGTEREQGPLLLREQLGKLGIQLFL